MTFGSPRTTIEIYKKAHYLVDLIILDERMPNLNGIETFKKMKEINQDAKAIIITGMPSTKSRELSKEEGILAYLTKPLRPSKINEKISQYLGTYSKNIEDIE